MKYLLKKSLFVQTTKDISHEIYEIINFTNLKCGR